MCFIVLNVKLIECRMCIGDLKWGEEIFFWDI